jgi:hypothetical protein
VVAGVSSQPAPRKSFSVVISWKMSPFGLAFHLEHPVSRRLGLYANHRELVVPLGKNVIGSVVSRCQGSCLARRVSSATTKNSPALPANALGVTLAKCLISAITIGRRLKSYVQSGQFPSRIDYSRSALPVLLGS